MLEPLLLTVAVITVPFGLYLAFDRKTSEQTTQRRINRHERTREALRRLAKDEAHWDLSHLRFEIRQNYRTIQKARMAADWVTLENLVAAAPLEDWRKEYERRLHSGVRWHMDPLEIVDVQPVNLQNHEGSERDYVTMEIETRRREYLQSSDGCYQEGSGFVGSTPDSIPIEMAKEYWTFVRREQGWVLVRCDRQFPAGLAFIDDSLSDPVAV